MVRKILKVKDVAEILGKNASGIYSMVARGEIPSHRKKGIGRYFLENEIEEWLEGDGFNPKEFE